MRKHDQWLGRLALVMALALCLTLPGLSEALEIPLEDAVPAGETEPEAIELFLDSDDAIEPLPEEADMTLDVDGNMDLLPADTDFEDPVQSAPQVSNADTDFEIYNGILVKYTGSSPVVIVPDGVTRIAANVFSNHREVISVELPASLLEISQSAFSGCDALTIYGYSGSPAENCALKNRLPFVSLGAIPTGVKLDRKGAVKLFPGDTLALKATVSPANALQGLTWTSSNAKVAKVSASGVVKAVDPGDCTITVATESGKTAKVTIHVPKRPESISLTCQFDVNSPGLWVNGENVLLTINRDSSADLEFDHCVLFTNFYPKGSESPVTWISSNPKVAKVSKTGKVTAVKVAPPPSPLRPPTAKRPRSGSPWAKRRVRGELS